MNIFKNNEILVSVVIVSYNSSDYIIETLDSVYNQSYNKIELIISDDCSSDNTIEICERWISIKKDRFVNTIIIKSDKNTGTASNCNRGIKASSGQWLKLMAADDLFLIDCIQINVDYINTNKNVKILVSDVQWFNDKDGSHIITNVTKPLWFLSNITTPQEQYKSLLIKFCGNTAAFFISKYVYEDILYDEEFPFIEDYSFVLTATLKNYFIYYLPIETVKYRVRTNSVFFGGTKHNIIFGNYYKKRRSFDLVYRHPYLSWYIRLSENYQYYRLSILDFLNLNKDTKINKAIFKMTDYLSPFRYLNYFFR